MAQEVDITNLVEAMRSTFVTLSVSMLYAASVSAAPWLGWPIIGTIYRWILGLIIGRLSQDVVLEAFFLNTALRKSGEAADYIAAVHAKLDATDDVEYARLEQAEIAAFNLFVKVT